MMSLTQNERITPIVDGDDEQSEYEDEDGDGNIFSVSMSQYNLSLISVKMHVLFQKLLFSQYLFSIRTHFILEKNEEKKLTIRKNKFLRNI